MPYGGIPTTTNFAPQALSFSAANLETVLAVVITIVFIWWAVFTLVAVYHWMRYARDTWLAVPALAVHLFVSAWIFIFATGGLH